MVTREMAVPSLQDVVESQHTTQPAVGRVTLEPHPTMAQSHCLPQALLQVLLELLLEVPLLLLLLLQLQ